MPSCYFYALRTDCMKVLDFVFEETDCQVYESYSEIGRELQQFRCADEVAKLYHLGETKGGVLLHLYSPSMKGDLKVEQIEFVARKLGPDAWRSSTHGWGLIGLHLEGLKNNQIHRSVMNHNSEKRALKWEANYLDRLGAASAWDWKAVNAISGRINRHIRNKLSVAKFNSRPVLPEAHERIQAGTFELNPA